jgi:hypothetical protein
MATAMRRASSDVKWLCRTTILQVVATVNSGQFEAVNVPYFVAVCASLFDAPGGGNRRFGVLDSMRTE